VTEAVRLGHAEVYKPGNEAAATPDLFIPSDDLASVAFNDRINRRKDTGTVAVHNDDGSYSAGDPRVDSGDLIRFYTAFRDDSVHYPDGDAVGGAFGDGGFGGRRRRWTAMVRDVELSYEGPDTSTLTLNCDDFAFAVLSLRRVFNAFEDTAISGSEAAILDTLLANNAPEVDRSGIQTVGETTSATYDGTNLLEAAVSLTSRANAVMRADDTGLEFRPLADLRATPRLAPSGADVSAFTSTFSDTGVANQVRVDGGKDRSVDDEQPTQDGYASVDQSNRLTFRVSTRKSNINRLELWTRPTGSEEDVVVRLQKDAGGQPVDVTDEESDIDTAQLSHEFLAADGFTTFIFGSNHTLPEPNPWVIIETDGDGGQDIGVDTSQTSASGDPLAAYRAYFEYDLTVRQTDTASTRQYRLREARISKDNIATLEEAYDVAGEKIDHDSTPEQTVEFAADTLALHEVQAGDVLELDFPRERVAGDYIVTERSDTYGGMVVSTDLTVTAVDNL
jgi:hypothetical protein